MPNREKIEIRDLRDGDWYWIERSVLNIYGKRLKASGIAVYNALALFANSKTQMCFPTQKAIAELLGLSRRTVIRKIRELEALGLIKVERIKGGCLYYLLKPDVTKGIQGCDKWDTSNVTSGNINNNYITRINNNIVNEDKNFLNSKDSFKGFRPKTKDELLALDLAEALRDRKSLPFYLKLSKTYPEDLLRRALGEVKEIPDKGIKKSRAALFNHLFQKYAKDTSKNHWN
jgi:DNA-binding Lrp family transcriptional regulator